MQPHPAAALMHARLTPKACPLLHEALVSLFELLRECDVDPATVLGHKNPDALLRARPTVAAWQEGGLVSQRALEAALAECGAAAEDDYPAATVDRFLVPVFLLGLGRMPAVPTFEPAWLREAIAALLAVDAWRPLLSPDLAPDDVLEGPGCHTDPRIGRLLPAARFLAGRLGFEALVQVAAGQVPLQDAIDSQSLDLAEALVRPGPWDALHVAARPGRPGEQDLAWLEDVVLASCVRRLREDGLPRAYATLPAGEGLVLDFEACALRPLEPAPAPGQPAEPWLDPAFVALPAPPTVCRAFQRAGWPGLVVHFEDADGLEDLVEVLIDLCDDPAGPMELAGEGFRIQPWAVATEQRNPSESEVPA